MDLAAQRWLTQASATVYGWRRSAATAAALLLAICFGLHAMFGANGFAAYARKRAEDQLLQQQLRALALENVRLHDRVNHLRSDPDTVEMEACQRLHYARNGEVIYTLGRPIDSDATSTLAGR